MNFYRFWVKKRKNWPTTQLWTPPPDPPMGQNSPIFFSDDREIIDRNLHQISDRYINNFRK